MSSTASPVVWGIFVAIVVTMLALDLGVFHRTAHRVSMREGALWVGIWVTLAMAFNAFVFFRFGTERGVNFLQAYLLEQALSVDNVFVFIVIFSYFRVPESYQHRVLFWGILGAVLTRGIFVLAGVALLSRFHWIMYGLGVFLIATAVKMLTQDDNDLDLADNRLLKWFRKLVPTTDHYEGARFVVVREGRRFATPLMAVLVVVESTDVMFAVDSIPAVFGVTTDVFIVYTSNIFAVLGLRSLFFLVNGLVAKLHLLKHGVALILAFIGIKILIEPWFAIPEFVSLLVLASILVISTVLSFALPAKEGVALAPPPPQEPQPPTPEA